MARPRLVVLSAPSGAGKTTVVAQLRQLKPDLHVSVSLTTRKQRPGEVDGQHYHFVDRDTFQRMIDNGELLEYDQYAGNFYGTPRAPIEQILAQGNPSLLEITVPGALQVKSAMPDAVLVFLAPPSWEVLETRLRGRDTETAETIAARLAIAQDEMASQSAFDHVIINADVHTAALELLELITGSVSNL